MPRSVMLCAVAMDPRLRTLALKLCVGVIGASSQEEVVWATVRDMVLWEFEMDIANEEADAVMSTQAVKRS